MSLISCLRVPVKNGCVPEINTSLTSVPTCQSSAVVPSEKVTDTVTGSKAHKILQYGSRHTIQNTGWTTRLSCDPSPRRNQPSVEKVPIPPTPRNLKPLCPRLPFLSISKPTVLKLQTSVASASTAAAANTGMAIQLVGCADNQPVGLQSTASSAAQCMVTSGTVLQTILAQPHMSASALSSSSTSVVNHAVLTMPTIDGNTAGKPATVCFLPISSVLCGPVPGLPTQLRIMENMPGTFAVPQLPTGLVGVNKVNMGPLLIQPGAADGNKTVVTDAVTKSVSSASAPSVKEILTWTPKGQDSDVRMLTMKVHIDHGRITEVTEVPQKQSGSQGTRTLRLDADVLTSAVGSACIDHIDTNGARFGYHDFVDGTRIRIARDTSGQRHAPFFLLSQVDDLHPFEECSVEIRTSTYTEPQVVPQEADVSEVGTVFTYEPFYVSEQTLTPVPRNDKRPRESSVGLSEDESHYCYRCYLCSYISDDHAKVCRHWVNVHLTELPYRCPFCDRSFFTSTKAQVHVQCQHRSRGVTSVAFQQSSYYANTLSYELGETDTEENSSSDEEEERPIVLERCVQRSLQRNNLAFACKKCRFQTRSAVEMRQHVKFVHGHGRYLRFCPPETAPQQEMHANSMQSDSTGHLLRAEIGWSNISEKVVEDGECRFKCRWCAFKAKNAAVMSSHVLQEHHWPSAVLCPSCSCSLLLTDDDRKSVSVECSSCKARILLVASTDSFAMPDVQDIVYMCNICAFKTRGKASMCLHIKYNHTKCRPYACVYCNYVAVERAQVKMHITNHHPDQSVIVKERTEANDQFRHILHNLFPKLVSVRTSETAGLQLNEGNDGAQSDGGTSVTAGDVDGAFFSCDECKFETSSIEQLIRHQHRFHKSTLAANAAMVPLVYERPSGENALPGEHFKCKICGYCCLDRSCMSRHVKYMHITARPHSCVYCSYNNVEKTKVRLHVMAHHPGLQKTVHTDQKVLEEMSWQAKHFYVRIGPRGQVVDESGSMVNRSSGSPVDRPSAESPSSSDSEDLLTDEQSEHHDVCTNNDGSTLVKKEGTYDDDDVDIDYYPRRNRVDEDDALFTSVVMLDHNYFRITPDDHVAAVTAHDDSVVIKKEPLDFEYEDAISGMLHSEFDSMYKQPKNHCFPEVKTEAADDLYSAAVNSLDEFEMSDSESDDFYDSEKSDDLDMLDDEISENESCPEADEPARKKIRVTFGVDLESEESMVESVVIESNILEDPKLHMTPVVELEDVLQIILAWQQNTGETDDIM